MSRTVSRETNISIRHRLNNNGLHLDSATSLLRVCCWLHFFKIMMTRLSDRGTGKVCSFSPGSAKLFTFTTTSVVVKSANPPLPFTPDRRRAIKPPSTRTARDTARSARPPDETQASNRRAATSTPSKPQARITSFRNVHFLLFDSTRVIGTSGATSFKARPGKPAPVPTSTMDPRSGATADRVARYRDSPNSSDTIFRGSLIAERLIRWFHLRSRPR